jgi:hypothetical protein
MFILAGCLLLVCCRQQAKTGITPGKKGELFVKPPSGATATLRINMKSAVFFQADSLQVQQLRSKLDPGLLETMLHEYFYQLRNARLVLQQHWKEVTMVEATKARWISFEDPTTGNKTIIDLDKNNELYGIYLFNPGKEPLFIDMVNIDTEAGFYYDPK